MVIVLGQEKEVICALFHLLSSMFFLTTIVYHLTIIYLSSIYHLCVYQLSSGKDKTKCVNSDIDMQYCYDR